jgi:bacillithiol synthase
MSLRSEFLSADILGLSDLARHALSGRPVPSRFASPCIPKTLGDLSPPEERFLPDERAELSAAIEGPLTALGSHVAVLEAVRALATPGASAVVAGQQPGFLGGPLFNIYKAVHAVRLSRDLQERWGKPVVPVFWNHADDHDIAEVHNVRLVTPNLDLRRLHLPGMSSGRTPFSAVQIDAEKQRLISVTEVLRDTFAADMFTQETLELFVPRDGETLARAWTRSMTTLFGHLGLVVIEPDWIRPSLSRSLATLVAPSPIPELLENKARLASAGFAVAIEPEEAALVYHVGPNGRVALRAGGDGYRFDGEAGSRTPSELAAEIVTAPNDYSAGALLRPLVQDLALPVAAYVGGFGELAYHVQLAELRRSRDVPETPFVPRLSCTLIDDAVESSLEQAGCTVGDFLRTKGACARSVDEESCTDDTSLSSELHAMSKSFRKELNALRPRLADVSPHLPQILKHTSRIIHQQMQRFADKVDRVANNNVGGLRRDERRLDVHLLPSGEAQERVLTGAQFLSRFGREWIDALLDEMDALPSEHMVLYLGPAPKRIREQRQPGTPGEDK